jgi:hypothetical protein
MNTSDHKAFKFAQKLQNMINEKEFSKEQRHIIISQLLSLNGMEGMADLSAQEHDIRDFDEMFLKGQIENQEFGVISFDDLSIALTSYTGRFWLRGLAKRKGRSKTYNLDEESSKKIVFMWRDLSSHKDLEDQGEA